MAGYDYYLVIDFEASGVVPQSSEWEIVEFPIVVVDATRLQILSNEFHRFVRPTTNPQLSRQCIENCGIKQSDVDAASPIDVVVGEAIAWLRELNIGSNLAVVTCGDYDLGTALRVESQRKSFHLPDWLCKWINIKVPFASQFGKTIGMKGMLSHLKLILDGRHHCGRDDARNIAKIVIELLKAGIALEVTGHHEVGRQAECRRRWSRHNEQSGGYSSQRKKPQRVRIDEPWLSWLVSGVKTHEGRLCRGMWSKLVPGDRLSAYSEKYAHVDLEVYSILSFDDFDKAFESLGKRLVPEGAETPAEALQLYRQWNSAEAVQACGGVVAVEVAVGEVTEV
jgi:inhibitor of KinA sporulation pathway (predicted exonuclease)/ASC-1-like (ASCH) protein